MSLVTETKIQSIPDVSRVADAQVRAALTAIKQLLDVREGKTPRNEPLDKLITWRGLYEAGMVNYQLGGRIYNYTGNNGTGFIGTVSPGVSTPAVPVVVTPTTPTGLTVSGAFSIIILSWDDPDLAYANHAYAEIWRADVDDIGQSVKIGSSPGPIFSDAVGAGVTKYYWIRFVSTTDTPGPYNSVSGTVGTTGTDPAYVLSVLADQITESQLAVALGTRIDLIDIGPSSLVTRIGSAEGDIITNNTDILALETTVNNPSTGVAANATGVSSLDTRVTTAEGNITANASSITTVQSTAGNNTAAIQTEAAVRAQAISPNWVANTSYVVGDTVTYLNQVYRCITANTDASWIAGKWAVASNVYGQYTVKIDTNNKVIGFGLANDGPGNASDDFTIVADKFSIVKPDGTGTKIPFIVDTGTGAVIMDVALIKDATITTAKIQSAFMDSLVAAQGILGIAHIDYLNVTTQALIVGTTISSGGISLSNGGAIRGGQGTFDTGTGFYLGYSGGKYKFSVGDAAANKMSWDGTDLLITGHIKAGSHITGSAFTTSGSHIISALSGGETSVVLHDASDFPSSGSGYFIDSSNNNDVFSWTGKSANTLTGCAGVLAHNANATVIFGQSIVTSEVNNEMYFYGDPGDGSLSKLVSIGINNTYDSGSYLDVALDIGNNVYTGRVINAVAATSFWKGAGNYLAPGAYFLNSGARVSTLVAQANGLGSTAIHGRNAAGQHIYNSGYAGEFDTQGLKAPIRLSLNNNAGAPTFKAVRGALAVDANGVLYINTGTHPGNAGSVTNITFTTTSSTEGHFDSSNSSFSGWQVGHVIKALDDVYGDLICEVVAPAPTASRIYVKDIYSSSDFWNYAYDFLAVYSNGETATWTKVGAQ